MNLIKEAKNYLEQSGWNYEQAKDNYLIDSHFKNTPKHTLNQKLKSKCLIF